tara:strand:- start:507 stop:791 length:285 start_codon:yes stop_codon:yes gene_type:complete
MKRIIVDYKKLNEEILSLLTIKFPNGYDDIDKISFRNARNEVIEAVEVRTEDTIYLVKVGKRLVDAMEGFTENEEEEDDMEETDDDLDISDDID